MNPRRRAKTRYRIAAYTAAKRIWHEAYGEVFMAALLGDIDLDKPGDVPASTKALQVRQARLLHTAAGRSGGWWLG